jgi:hypothetical protein
MYEVFYDDFRVFARVRGSIVKYRGGEWRAGDRRIRPNKTARKTTTLYVIEHQSSEKCIQI